MAGAAKRGLSVSDVEWKWDDADVKKGWEAFMKFGNASGVEITGKNFDKWLKDAGLLDPKTISTTITGIAFSKVTGPKRKTLTYNETKEVLVKVAEDRATKTKKTVQEELDLITEKLAALEGPSHAGATKPVAANVVDRLTDTSKYTGSHKERFDESGKGKGKAGRAEQADNSGYVGAYKNKGTYDQAHGK